MPSPFTFIPIRHGGVHVHVRLSVIVLLNIQVQNACPWHPLNESSLIRILHATRYMLASSSCDAVQHEPCSVNKGNAQCPVCTNHSISDRVHNLCSPHHNYVVLWSTSCVSKIRIMQHVYDFSSTYAFIWDSSLPHQLFRMTDTQNFQYLCKF